jgi:uncharacterized protein
VSFTHLLPVDWLQELAIFPLPGLVFFPGTVLPLHIFEPRYRTMMQDCLKSGRLALAVTLLKPGYEAEYQGRPAIHDLCTVGRIERHEELPDGRFDLVLKGLHRVKLRELPADGLPYRRASAELLDLRRGSERCSRDSITTLISTASQVAALVRRAHPDFSLGMQPDDAPHHVADTLADRLLADPDARQDVLETLDVAERVKKVTSYVASLLAELESENTKRPLQ